LNIITKYSFILFVATIGISGQILLKKGLNAFSHLQFNGFFSKILTIVFEPFILLALFCYAVGLAGYLFLLSKAELTSVYPICTSLVFAGITFFGWFFLKESLSWPKISGIILIIIGIFLIERFG
jgi:drug/metabolite transporter (DMT)-like permease